MRTTHKPIESWHVEEVTLWYTPDKAFEGGRNEGFPIVLEVLPEAAQRNPSEIRLIDASSMSGKERWDVYIDHGVTCRWWKYEVRRVFGTNSDSGGFACK